VDAAMLGATFPQPRMIDAQHTTHDPYLASFLLSEGAALLRSQRIGPKKVAFSFAADARLHDLLRLYWSEVPTPAVPARLFAALRLLKSRSAIEA
jgi:hypothetical protein